MSAEPVPEMPPGDDPGSLPEFSRMVDSLRKVLAGVDPRVAAEAGSHLRLVGRARKVSVSMPEDLTDAIQQRVGRGEFSRYVTEAVAHQLELDLLGELSALLQTDYGPVSEEHLAEARRAWPDAG